MMTGAMPLDDMRDAQEAIHFFLFLVEWCNKFVKFNIDGRNGQKQSAAITLLNS